MGTATHIQILDQAVCANAHEKAMNAFPLSSAMSE